MSTRSKIKSILTRWSAFFASGGVSLDLAVNDVDRLIKLIMYDERPAARAQGYELGYADAKKDQQTLGIVMEPGV